MERKRRAIEFVRVSGKKQAKTDKDGIPRQERALARNVEKFGLIPVKRLKLMGISGAYTQYTNQFDDLVALMAIEESSSPKTFWSACNSHKSPTRVDVACALM